MSSILTPFIQTDETLKQSARQSEGGAVASNLHLLRFMTGATGAQEFVYVCVC